MPHSGRRFRRPQKTQRAFLSRGNYRLKHWERGKKKLGFIPHGEVRAPAVMNNGSAYSLHFSETCPRIHGVYISFLSTESLSLCPAWLLGRLVATLSRTDTVVSSGSSGPRGETTSLGGEGTGEKAPCPTPNCGDDGLLDVADAKNADSKNENRQMSTPSTKSGSCQKPCIIID